MFWIFTGAEIAILSLAIFGCISGFVQIQKLSHSFRAPYDLDNLLSSVTIIGAYIYAIFSIISAGVNVNTLETKNIVVLIQNILLLIQVSCQGTLMLNRNIPKCHTLNLKKYKINKYQFSYNNVLFSLLFQG